MLHSDSREAMHCIEINIQWRIKKFDLEYNISVTDCISGQTIEAFKY